jgi:hypothetical protein
LTIKSTSHTTRRYFLLRLHTCVSATGLPLQPQLLGDMRSHLPIFVCPSNIQLSKIDFS